MRMDNFLEEREEVETGVEVNSNMDINTSPQNVDQMLFNNRYYLLQGNSLAQDNEVDQQPSPRSPRIQQTTNRPLKKSPITHPVLQVKRTQPELERNSIKKPRRADSFFDAPSPDMLDNSPTTAGEPCSDAWHPATNSLTRTSPSTRLKGGHQKDEVPAELPGSSQVDYELDPPVLFSINSDDNREILVGFKSLAEELMDATEQPINQQPMNLHLTLASQPTLESPPPRSTGKVKNGCVLDKQTFEEIETISSTAREATLEVTSPEGYLDSNIK
ncbi:UNVERIFIED_CONTAM: hypothetical protein K2H54_038689 [Gekko kuhli]